jgi:hypothetical protein
VVLLIGVSPLVLGYGLLAGRRWARRLGVFLWVGLAVAAAGAQVLAGGGADQLGYELLWGAILSGLAYWYLYGNARVRAYYRQLEGRGS